MHYIDSITGATCPLDQPRWRGDSGGHLNLADAPGLARSDIDISLNSLWRYRKALLVDAASAASATSWREPRTVTTSAPHAAICAIFGYDAASGTRMRQRMPAAAQYAESEAPALPDESSSTSVTPWLFR